MPLEDLVRKELPIFEMPIERGKIKEFADAIGDPNPIYHDPSFARETKFGGILAPPTFTATKAFWRIGGTNSEIAGLDNRFVLHGEEEYEYFKPILAGEILTCKSRISDAHTKEGKRGGKMLFVIFEFNFFNRKGEKVLVSRSTIIQTDKSEKN